MSTKLQRVPWMQPQGSCGSTSAAETMVELIASAELLRGGRAGGRVELILAGRSEARLARVRSRGEHTNRRIVASVSG
jgi:hypothetical protein